MSAQLPPADVNIAIGFASRDEAIERLCKKVFGGVPLYPDQLSPMSPQGLLEVTDGSIPLRDWFAGMAMSGLLSNPFSAKACEELCGEPSISKASFGMADKMLEASKNKGETAP